jgi:hypothetical protein
MFFLTHRVGSGKDQSRLAGGGPSKIKNSLRPRKLGLRQFFIFEGLNVLIAGEAGFYV